MRNFAKRTNTRNKRVRCQFCFRFTEEWHGGRDVVSYAAKNFEKSLDRILVSSVCPVSISFRHLSTIDSGLTGCKCSGIVFQRFCGAFSFSTHIPLLISIFPSFLFCISPACVTIGKVRRYAAPSGDGLVSAEMCWYWSF